MRPGTRVFPSVPVATSGQRLVSHAGLSVLTSFMNALGMTRLGEDRLGQFIPLGAKHRPGRIVGSLAMMLSGAGSTHPTWTPCATAPAFSDRCLQGRRCRDSLNAP